MQPALSHETADLRDPAASVAASSGAAVLIPCYNEELTIAAVVAAFRTALPQATIYVYDNNSSDRTSEVARQAGAVVRSERRQGKGNVVRRMFADIDADIYVLVDGDDTYDAAAAPRLIRELVDNDLDFVNGARVSTASAAYRRGHRLGNFALTELVRIIFGRQFTDMLSGYKVLSARFVKSFPAMSSGFETETELAVHALELRMPCGEIETAYKERPEGSVSKLSTYRDGWRILKLIGRLVKDERPLQFFGLLGLVDRPQRDRARRAGRRDLSRDRPRAAAADGGPQHRARHSRGAELLCRLDPRHGHADPAGNEAPRLSFVAKVASRLTRRSCRFRAVPTWVGEQTFGMPLPQPGEGRIAAA